MTRALLVAVLTLGIFSLSEHDVHAYIDPGTGAFILQFVLAGVFGAAFAVKMYWRKIKRFVNTRILARAPSDGEQQEKF